MLLTLEPELEQRLEWEASRNGLPLEKYATRILGEHVSQAEREQREAAIALIQSWIDEAGSVSEEEELDDEFFRNLEENRLTFRELSLPE